MGIKWEQRRSSAREIAIDVLTLGMTAKTGFLLERAGVTTWGGRVAQHAKLHWYDRKPGGSFGRVHWTRRPWQGYGINTITGAPSALCAATGRC